MTHDRREWLDLEKTVQSRVIARALRAVLGQLIRLPKTAQEGGCCSSATGTYNRFHENAKGNY
jgi:hypothetical protein